MADLTPDQAIEKLRTLPEDKQRAVLTQLSPDIRKGILAKLTSQSSTPGQKYQQARASGALPKKEVFTSGKEAIEQGAERLQEKAQEEQNLATPSMYRQGQYAGERSIPVRAGHALMSGVYGTAAVPVKMISGLMDPASAAATAALATPVTAPFGAAYLMTQGAKGTYESAKDIKEHGATPENTQNLFLSAATVASGPAGAEEGKAPSIAELKKAAADRAQGLTRNVTGVTRGVKDTVVNTAKTQVEDIAANKAKRADTIKENLETQRQARTDIDRDKQAVAEKNKGIESENQAQAESVKRRGELAKKVDEQSKALKGHVEKVEQGVAKEANAKFDQVHAKVGNPEAPSDPLIAKVKDIEKNILQDVPENIKEFRAIMKLEGTSEELNALRQDVMTGQGISGKYEDLPPERKALVDEIAKNYGEEPEAAKPVTWDKLQSLKSRIEARLRKSRGMNGDLKRGLYALHDTVLDTMGSMAESKGAGPEWQDARKTWRQYKEDFHEPTGPSGSGSPVAKTLDAVDPQNIRQPFLGPAKERAIATLQKYPQHGGTEAAAAAQELIQTHQGMTELPKKATPKALKENPQAVQLPANKAMPARPETPTVDLDEAARTRIAQTAERTGRLNAWDARVLASSAIAGILSPFIGLKGSIELGATYVVTKMALANALDNPKVIAWIAKTPPAELAAIQRLPNVELVKIKTALRDGIKEAKIKNVSPELRAFLGGATGSAIQTPGEAKERAREFAPAQ
jgi:hypothetical protein